MNRKNLPFLKNDHNNILWHAQIFSFIFLTFQTAKDNLSYQKHFLQPFAHAEGFYFFNFLLWAHMQKQDFSQHQKKSKMIYRSDLDDSKRREME